MQHRYVKITSHLAYR